MWSASRFMGGTVNSAWGTLVVCVREAGSPVCKFGCVLGCV